MPDNQTITTAPPLPDRVLAVLALFSTLTQTDHGARLETHCLYPGFEAVRVYIETVDGGYRVHDGGGAARCAWDNGHDAIGALAHQAAAYRLAVVGRTLMASVPDDEWLIQTILSVANASAGAARMAVEG